MDFLDFRATQMVIVCGTHLLQDSKEYFLIFAIDEYVFKTNINQPAEFDSYDIPNQRRNGLLRLHDHFQRESSQSVLNDNKWECDKKTARKGNRSVNKYRERYLLSQYTNLFFV